MRTEEARPVRLVDYRPPEWLVDSVELDVALDPIATRVRARLALRPNANGGPPAPLTLDGEGLLLRSVALDGATLAPEQYVATPDRLSIAQPPQRPFSLEIETVVDPSANTELSGLYRSGSIYCTQCEAEGFRRITYFLDRPDVMAVYTTRIEAPKGEAPVLLANGNLVAAGDIAGTGRHFAVWNDPFPKPSYLFAMVGGSLACVEDCFRTMSGRDVTLRIYVEPGKESRCGHAMESLKRAMRWDETAFGREYDLDVFMIVAVSDFNMGAMENKGLNIFNDKYVLASAETATDDDFDRIEAIVAHEYFHNWTGNRITCRDWFQLCLKEGLTVFRDQEFTADLRSRAVERICDVRALRGHQFDEDAGPLAHPVRPSQYHEINNFYTTTVYEKGAEVVRMLRTLLGARKFREGMDLYFVRHDGRAATVEELVQCFADASGVELTQFMLWYSQAGTPEVVATGNYDAVRRSYRLELVQTVPPTPGQPSKEPMVIPLAVGLVGADGRDLPINWSEGTKPDRPVLTLSKPAQSFLFRDVAEPPVLSLNRDFSAPIKLVVNQSAEHLLFLATHDGDAFNRWEAFQTLATRLLVDNASALRMGGTAREDAMLADALRAALADGALEPAFVALMLTLPGEADIAREIGRDVDPAAVFAARAGLRARIGGELGAGLLQRYGLLAQSGPYRVDPISVGRRALRNTCLDLLVATQSRESISLARRQYHSAGNMTDRIAALSALSRCDTPERGDALEDFYSRYRGEALIIDKWFSLQAVIPEAGTLDRVKTLTAHPAFSFANPNRVRALVHAFALGNLKEFNRPDGAGYDFVADTVLALDGKNPQVAARLLSAFKSWRVLEPQRRERARSALLRVSAAPGLSLDVTDIARRALSES
ncbi:MAG TPA: aminopeptidase N [Xanthobacteraceae bacterium]|jgi:aminopeptidase N